MEPRKIPIVSGLLHLGWATIVSGTQKSTCRQAINNMLYLNQIKRKREHDEMNDENITLATEILKELQASARRWFIAFIIMMCIEVATIFGFLWYISLPVEDTIVTQEVDTGDNNRLIGIGDSYYGTTNGEKN